MKTTGKEWKTFLDSWPEYWYMDEVEVFVNGECDPAIIEPDAVVEFTGGVIVIPDFGGNSITKSLTESFSTWKKQQEQTTFLVTCKKSKRDELIELIKSSGGRIG